MLQKEWRISRGKEYSYIYANGLRLSGKYMIVFVIRNLLSHNRFGIVTSKKVGNAVTRNRTKRRIREVIRKNMDLLPSGYDIVIVARFNTKEANFALIEKDYVKMMRKASTY